MVGHPPPPRVHVKDAASRQQARQHLLDYGAVILTNLYPAPSSDGSSSWDALAAGLPNLLFDTKELLLGKNHTSTAVHEENSDFGMQGKELLPHTDGYIWGDGSPDLVMLLCEQPAPTSEESTTRISISNGSQPKNENDHNPHRENGENYLIDGKKVIADLDNETVKFLEQVDVDHTERIDKGGLADGVECIHPVFRYHPRKMEAENEGKKEIEERLCWKRMIRYDLMKANVDPLSAYLSLWTDPTSSVHDKTTNLNSNKTTTPNSIALQDALQTVDQVIARQAATAPRFILAKGEALICDNYRVLHARTAYDYIIDLDDSGDNGCNVDIDSRTTTADASRRMWRVWSWTTDSKGLPPGHMSNGEGESKVVAASVTEVSKVLKEKQSQPTS